MIINSQTRESLPVYLTEIYGNLYEDDCQCAKRDHILSCQIRSLFQYKKLVNAVISELKSEQNILQMGVTFGSQIDEVASFIGAEGNYDIIDINAKQIIRAKEKYGHIYPCLRLSTQDARTLKTNAAYDVVICFMLLSEMPLASKTKTINNALKQVKEGGKVIFVDWHNPLFYHPLRYFVRMINRLRNPFVEKLWDRQIDAYAETQLKSQFSWRKSTYFGRMFQKVVATKKKNPLIEMKTKTSEKKN